MTDDARMAMTVEALLNAIDKAPKERDKWIGPSVSGAASMLGISRQRIYQLVDQGRLTLVELWTTARLDQSKGIPVEWNLSDDLIEEEAEDGWTVIKVREPDGSWSEVDWIPPADAAGTQIGAMVTMDSIKKFRASDRAPGRRPKSKK